MYVSKHTHTHTHTKTFLSGICLVHVRKNVITGEKCNVWPNFYGFMCFNDSSLHKVLGEFCNSFGVRIVTAFIRVKQVQANNIASKFTFTDSDLNLNLNLKPYRSFNSVVS